MVTIKDVAKEAGVSLATISRVINGAENVSPEIRSKVQEAIKKLGYFPNNAARSLVKRQSGAIAVLLRDLHSPFYTDLIKGFEDGAAETKHNVVFCSLGRDQDTRDRYMQYLTNGIADAIILYGSLFSDQPIIEKLYESKFPFLLIEHDYDTLPLNEFLINNLEGARNAVEYLIEKKHVRIAHFMGDPNKKVNLERFNGYTQSMQQHGIPIQPDFIKNIFKDYTMASQYAAQFMKQPFSQRPTAIFCSNDRIAAAAIQGIQEAGGSVPGDMSIIGFDNQKILMNDYHGSSITSVKQPLYQIGYDSIHSLIHILEGKSDARPLHRIYDTELVILDTVAECKETNP